MTREPSAQPSQLQISKPASAREVIAELERLAIHFPRTDMDSRKWQLLFETFREDMADLSIEQIREGCLQYRNDPDNRFFPTPGQLKEACKGRFEHKEQTFFRAPKIEPIPREEAAAIIEKRRAQYGHWWKEQRGEKSLEEHKAEILARPIRAYVETPPDVKKARAEALKRRLEAVDFYGKADA